MVLAPLYIRPATVADSKDLARILLEANNATFRGLVPDYCLTSLSAEESARNWKRTLTDGFEDGQFLLVAVGPDGRMVGYALAGGTTGLTDFERELKVLMVDPACQRQGVGRRLVSEVAGRLLKQDIRIMLVRVLKENPNRQFYEHLGARAFGSEPYDWAGYQTSLVLYRWDDIGTLSKGATTGENLL